MDINNSDKISIRELEDLMEISPFPILIHKMGQIRYLNKLCLEMFEMENENDVIGKNLLDITYEEDKASVVEAVKQGMTNQVRNTVLVARMVTAKGNVLNTETKSVTINFRGEECRLVVAYNYDQYSKVQAELYDKSLLLEKIAQIIPDSLIVVDNHTREVLFENKPLMEMLGYTHEDLNGEDQFKLFARIIHKEDVYKLVEARKFLYAEENEGKYISTEYRVKAKDGTWRWILSRSTLFRRLDGRGHQINFGIAQDITPLKNIEQELIESKSFIEKITKTIPDHISIFELSPRGLVYDNFFYGSMLGYERGEAPEDMMAYFADDYKPTASANVLRIKNLKDGEQFTTITKNITKSGEVRYLVSAITPFLMDEEGKPIQFLSASRDITEFKEAEFRLQLSEEERKAILLALPDMLFQVSALGRVEAVYPSEMYRESIERLSLPGNSVDEIVPREFAETFMSKVRSAIDNDQIQTTEYTHRERTREFRYEFRVTKLNESAVIVMVRDITSLYQTRQELNFRLEELSVKNKELERYITSNTELEKFAYIASHDLREPIRSIIGFTQLLQKKSNYTSDGDSKEFLDNIINSAQRMNSLVHGLLDYSRVSSFGKEFETCDLNDLMQKVRNDLKAAIEESSADLIIGDLPSIKCDALQIRQLFQNLLSNAMKFHKPNEAPVVKISAERQDNKWLFSITDNGIGMDMKYSEKVFQIFARLHGADRYQGSGIGLTVCKKIVERHGGEIWLKSEIGKGTTFYFTLAGE